MKEPLVEINQYQNQYQLRQHVKAEWSKPHSINYAMIVRSRNIAETIHNFKMFASELGARFILLKLEGSLLPDHLIQLQRKGPRLVLIDGIETLPAAALAALPTDINAGGRAFPVILWNDEPTTNADVENDQSMACAA